MLNNIRAFLVKETDHEKIWKTLIYSGFSASREGSVFDLPHYERLFSEALSSHTSTSHEVLMMCYCGRWNLENFAAHMGQVKNWPLLDPEFIKASSSSLYVTKVEERGKIFWRHRGYTWNMLKTLPYLKHFYAFWSKFLSWKLTIFMTKNKFFKCFS